MLQTNKIILKFHSEFQDRGSILCWLVSQSGHGTLHHHYAPDAWNEDEEEDLLERHHRLQGIEGDEGVSNGNFSAVKKESKISGWLPFLKIFLEWAQIITEGQRNEISDDD